ncbi:transporter [Vulcanibacillus modesticaldus]|uniref:Transporter n=1 Tax=Vulcanibacillus modesticaldus TaxID=337097 RepID=A0A1D2YUT8_9BACI|nr:cation diffusion facilitator family transporter [Vulcanibacillus modesticaldus]OEF99459.1 transporter [Vulcanibacillus modesticaldus]
MGRSNGNNISADRGAWISMISYLSLSTIKLIMGYLFNSTALVADGLNNTTDIIASVAVLIGLKMSRKPPDANHPYGHSRAETIASLVTSLIMATIGIQVLIDAVRVIFSKEQVVPDIAAAWIALIGALIMLLVFFYNRSLSIKTNSRALMAVAKDNFSDAMVSLGAFVGIIGAQYNFPWLDPLAAIIVGIIILKTSWDIFSEATHMLTDGFEPNELEPLKETILTVTGVKDIKDIKARSYGNEIVVDAVIEVNPDLNVLESHNITDQIEEKMRSIHKIKDVHIHIEPKMNTGKEDE